MNGAFYIGATGLDAQQRALEVVANNIANLNTNGFKRSQARFTELIGAVKDQSDVGAEDERTPPPLWGVSVDTSPLDLTQGPLTQTGQPLDVAISGPGFIELLGPGGQVQLWRGGTLEVNDDGYLASSSGTPLKAMISVPANASNLSITSTGSVMAVTDSSGVAKSIGQIELVQDKNPAGLTAATGGVYQPANLNDLASSAPGEDGVGVLVQGSLESSNVDLSTEMITMLLMQRAYASNAQIIQAGDQLMSIANELRR
jgi:flagellar basal-body rod protein FlgG